jgi:hypothetical protein
MKKLLILIALINLFWISESHAFRCGNEIITRGDSESSVLDKCGEPERRETTYEVINGQLQYVKKLFYNCGENDFLYGLIIIDSKVFKDDPFKRGTGANKCKAKNFH